MTAAAKEREIERGLLTHLRDLLLELGRGFSFVGSQVPVTVDEQTFYIDLLFYHVRLHRYFVFELKVGAFQPEHAGKLGFYLAAVNRTMRTPVEGPSIGVLLCESRSGPMVEFALETINQPIGVSTYQVTRELPAPMQEELPSVEDLQEVVNKLRSEMETLRRKHPMRNKAIPYQWKRGIVRSGQFCNGPLQNWNLNTHRPDEPFGPAPEARSLAPRP